MKKLQRKAKAEPGVEKEPKEERTGESPHSDHSKRKVLFLSLILTLSLFYLLSSDRSFVFSHRETIVENVNL